MLLFFVRHGDPIYSPDSLTEQGQLQAEALVARMKLCAPEKIFASSSNRAILTAKPTAEYFGQEIEILDWCNEHYAWQDLTVALDDGCRTWAFAHKPTVELFASEEIRRLDKEWYTHEAFKDTSYEKGILRIQRETDGFMKNLGFIHKDNGYFAENPSYKRVALFAHQGFGLAFLSCLLDLPYPMMSTRFDMGHSGMTVIEFSDSGFSVPKVLQLSNDSHIFKSVSLKTCYQNRVEF